MVLSSTNSISFFENRCEPVSNTKDNNEKGLPGFCFYDVYFCTFNETVLPQNKSVDSLDFNYFQILHYLIGLHTNK